MRIIFKPVGLDLATQQTPGMTAKPNNDKQTSDWHIDQHALATYYALSGVQPMSAEDGLRLSPTFGQAEGYRELINLDDGFQVVIGDITCHEEAFVSMQSDAILKFHFRLEGSGGFGVKNEAESPISQHTLGVLLQPDGTPKQEHYLAGEHERSVTLMCSADFLQQRFASVSNNLPSILADYIDGKKPQFFATRMPMRADMATAAAAILSSELQGALRKCYAESRALELLILSFNALMEAEEGSSSPDRGLTKRDIERMHEARKVLDDNYITPPTIGVLARHIGVNEAKLMHAFKQLFGQTIFDYTQSLRMDQAKQLLEATELSITEVAFEVGYEYSSNFTTAFKRRFGITPSVARDAFRN